MLVLGIITCFILCIIVTAVYLIVGIMGGESMSHLPFIYWLLGFCVVAFIWYLFISNIAKYFNVPM